MEDLKKRSPRAPWFSSQYSQPFHQDVKRLDQTKLNSGWDPFEGENRQVVANCKKHRRQRHNLSDKCKSVLSIIDFQERLLSVEGAQIPGQSPQAGVAEVKADILIRFGNGIPEISKEYIKHWISSSGIVQEPYSREYDVHAVEDKHKHKDRFTVILKVPFFEAEDMSPEEVEQVIEVYMENPKKFAEKLKVRSVYLYGRNKVSGEDDAFGVDIEGVPGPIAIVEGREVKPVNKADMGPVPDDYFNQHKSHYETKEGHRIANAREDRDAEYAKLTAEQDKREENEKKIQTEADENAKKLRMLRTKQLLTDLMDPNKNIAPLGVSGGWTNPLGQTLRLLESGGKTLGNIGDHVDKIGAYHDKKAEARKKVNAQMDALFQRGTEIDEKLKKLERELKQGEIESAKFEEQMYGRIKRNYDKDPNVIVAAQLKEREDTKAKEKAERMKNYPNIFGKDPSVDAEAKQKAELEAFEAKQKHDQEVAANNIAATFGTTPQIKQGVDQGAVQTGTTNNGSTSSTKT